MVRAFFLSREPTFFIAFFCFISGCAAPGTSDFQYHEPTTSGQLVNEAIVDLPFTDVWDMLIDQLDKSTFIVNNVEQVPGSINLFFWTDQPEDFIDCGISERHFAYDGELQKYLYKTAGSSSFKVAGQWGPFQNLPLVAYVNRKTTLEGRVHIYIAPRQNDTIVTVSTRYVLTGRMSGQQHAINILGAVVQIDEMPEEVYTLSFNTNQIGSANWGSAQDPTIVECRSTGKLEGDIFAMMKR